jgi:hypothetical protein
MLVLTLALLIALLECGLEKGQRQVSRVEGDRSVLCQQALSSSQLGTRLFDVRSAHKAWNGHYTPLQELTPAREARFEEIVPVEMQNVKETQTKMTRSIQSITDEAQRRLIYRFQYVYSLPSRLADSDTGMLQPKELFYSRASTTFPLALIVRHDFCLQYHRPLHGHCRTADVCQPPRHGRVRGDSRAPG